MVSAPTFRSELKRVKSGGGIRQSHDSIVGPTSVHDLDESISLLGGQIMPRTEVFVSARRELWWPFLTLRQLVKVLKSSHVHLLLALLPFTFLATLLHWPPIAQFVLSFISIIPLSSLSVFVLDDLSTHLGQMRGGLAYATLGNAVEIVFGIVALQQAEIRLLQASLTGLIFSSTLFGPSCCFIAGGLCHREQDLSAPVTLTMSFIMVVATVSMVVPTTVQFIALHISEQSHDIAALSQGTAIVLLLIYICYLAFQLRTHADIFDTAYEEEDEAYEEEVTLNIWFALIAFGTVTTLVALCAEILVGNIDAIVELTNSSRTFIGFIFIPFLSNASDNITAVQVALRNNMELAMSVAIGSSLQIILFVTPLLVIVGWIIGCQLTLSFGILEAVVLLLSSFVVVLILHNGRSNYLDGVLCMGLYIIIAMTFFVFADDGVA